MSDRQALSTLIARVGAVAVPYSASWTAEERPFVGMCPYARRMALRMPQARGEGKPLFGKPHYDRQREAIANGLCDLCGRPLKTRTKISLSHARYQSHAAAGGSGILQVEPLLHRECAAESLKFCPSLNRDIASGTLMIRQVYAYRVQFAVMGPQYIQHYVPDYQPKPTDRIIGHAKVELMRWIDRDQAWLGGTHG